LRILASKCARGEGCALSLEEARAALGLAGWAASRLAKLADAPVKVEGAGLVEAYDIENGKLHVLPCLQVSMNGERRLMCQGVHLSRNPGRGWRVKGSLRLVPIGKRIKMMADALAELGEMVSEYIRRRESEGAERIHGREHRGEFLMLEEIVLRRRDGTEEVLLKPWFYKLNYLGEGFAVVECSDGCPRSSDGELAAMIGKEVEKVMGEVRRACRRYVKTGDPQLTALAYIVVEALRRAGLA